uniref:Uncharacterized protein n=1 Tax=Sphaerodactylus townsendi TaxID=933632 RepID=A0ACB8EC92_9SAUR
MYGEKQGKAIFSEVPSNVTRGFAEFALPVALVEFGGSGKMHQRLLDILNKERETLKGKIEESLMQQSQEYKEILEKHMADERQKNREALATAAKSEKESVQAAILVAVKEERENMEKLHMEEKERWQTERSEDCEKIAQAVEDAMQEHKQNSQSNLKAMTLGR